MKLTNIVALSSILVLSSSGCVPMLIGGAFYSTNTSKKLCADLLDDENLTEKIKIPEYREYYQKVCKPKNKADFDSAKKPADL